MARHLDVQYVKLYTDGTAARKMEIASAPKPVRKPHSKKKTQIVLHVDPVAIFGMAVAAVMLVLMLTGMAQLKATQQKTAEMEQYIVSLQAENNTLEAGYHNSYDLAEVERIALALGMVPKDQAQQADIRVAQPQTVEETPGMWTNFWTFLTGLFA